jgi:hypothetical protein
MSLIPFANLPLTERQWTKYLQECIVFPDQAKEYTVAQLADVPRQTRIAFVTNETGGYVLAFRDASDVWRRCTDRAICS